MELKEQLTKMTQKSLRSIDSARELFKKGDYDFSLSRTYYSVFYMLEAILLTKNLTFSKHGNVIGAFNKNFVKDGIFPKEYSNLISRLFRERHVADYEFDIKLTQEETEENIIAAENIIKNIIDYLVKGNYIDPINR